MDLGLVVGGRLEYLLPYLGKWEMERTRTTGMATKKRTAAVVESEVMGTRKYAEDGVTLLSDVRKRLEWVKVQITKYPEKYDQSNYCAIGRCGTVGCIAGWLDVLKNGMQVHCNRVEVVIIVVVAMGMLGLIHHQPWLFSGSLIVHTKNRTKGSAAYAQAACDAIDKYLVEIGA